MKKLVLVAVMFLMSFTAISATCPVNIVSGGYRYQVGDELGTIIFSPTVQKYRMYGRKAGKLFDVIGKFSVSSPSCVVTLSSQFKGKPRTILLTNLTNQGLTSFTPTAFSGVMLGGTIQKIFIFPGDLTNVE